MRLSHGWKLFLVLSFVAGLLLRTINASDMEYKQDEHYDYTQSQLIGTTEPWPAYGIASGVYIVNPGMSIWVFAALAKITDAHTPTQLAHSVQLFAVLGISLLLLFALLYVPAEQREPWFWAFALAMVDPMTLLYQRKLWPQPFLPVFSMLMLAGWWFREKRWGAFVWGLVGALIGQVHMSGFFFAAGFLLWTFLFSKPEKRKAVRWRYWFLGSCLGAIPLIPWAYHILSQPIHTSLQAGWVEMVQLKYWVFWISDAFGLHLGNTLGIYIGDHQWQELSDFIRYPLIDGHATYLVGLAHLGILCVAGWMLVHLVRYFAQSMGTDWRKWRDRFIGRESETAFAQNAAFWGSGILMELPNLQIRRYYLSVVFPFDFLWLTRLALRNPKSNAQLSSEAPRSPPGRKWLAALWACQLVISTVFVYYVHVNNGSPKGDYGYAYHVVIQREAAKLHSTTKP